MKTKSAIIATLIVASLVFSCKKKDSTEEEPAPAATTGSTTGTPVVTNMNFAQSIGSSGTALGEFNFDMNGQDMAWGMATDGVFVYVADYGNNCVKKVDLSTNTVVGWYGFKGTTWGFYNDNAAASPLFKPVRLVFKNNSLYAFVRKQNTGKSTLFKFDINGLAVDSSKVIPVYSFYTADIDHNENVIICASDSIKIYLPGGTIRFGGKGSGEGRLDNGGYIVQVQASGDTIVVVDAGNSRIQKFTNGGIYMSKFSVSLPLKDYTYFSITNNKYYIIENGKLVEYSANGVKLNEYPAKGNPSGFGVGQKQFVIVNNKVVFEDPYTSKLHVFTK